MVRVNFPVSLESSLFAVAFLKSSRLSLCRLPPGVFCMDMQYYKKFLRNRLHSLEADNIGRTLHPSMVNWILAFSFYS